MGKGFLLVAWLGFVCLTHDSPGAEPSTKPTRHMPVADGWVQAIAERDGTVYVGGQFSRIGKWSGSAVLVNANTGELVRDFPKINGTVSAALPDGSGGYFIAGKFSEVGGIRRSNLVHITSQRQLDLNWTPTIQPSLHAIYLSGDTLYFVSDSSQDAAAKTTVGAVHRATGAILPFNLALNGYINGIVASGSKVFLGGKFTGPVTVDWLRAYDLNGNPIPFNANPNCGVYGEVSGVALAGDRLYVAGGFTSIGGQTRSGLAVVSADTGLALDWDVGTNVTAYNMTLQDGVLAFRGSFTNNASQVRTNFAAFNAATGELLPVQPEALAAYTSAIGISADWFIFGGTVTWYSGYQADKQNYVVLANRQTGAARFLNNIVPNFTVNTIAANGSEFLLGGIFSMVESQERLGAAAFNAATGEVLAWNPKATTNVLALAVAGDRVFIAGELTNVAGQTRKALAAVDRTTGATIPGWTTDSDAWIIDLALHNDTLYAGGIFQKMGGLPRTNIAAIDIKTGAVLPWDAKLNRAWVRAIKISGDTMYIGGAFRSANGVGRVRLAAFDLLGGELTDWNPNGAGASSGNIDDIEVSGSTIYVAGRFTSIGGVLRTNVASISLTGEILPWAPNPSGFLYDIAIDHDVLFMTGQIDTVNRVPRQGIAAVSASSGANLDWDPRINFLGNCLTVAGGQLYVGGIYYTLFDEARLGLAAFNLSDDSVDAPSIDPTSITIDASGVVEFRFPSRPGVSLIPQFTSDFQIWTDLPAHVTQDGQTTVRDDTAGLRQNSYYRLKQ